MIDLIFPPWDVDSADAPASIDDYLKATKHAIEVEYRARIEPLRGVSFEEFWNHQCEWMFSGPKKNLRKITHLFDISHLPERDTAGWALVVATSYWLEASYKLDFGKPGKEDHSTREKCWAMLVRCHFYLGMASGPVSEAERNALGGKTRGLPSQAILIFARELLAAFPDGHFRTKNKAIRAIAPQVASYKPKGGMPLATLLRFSSREQKKRPGRPPKDGQGRTQNAEQFIDSWSLLDEKLYEALYRVVKGGITPGAKKGARGEK